MIEPDFLELEEVLELHERQIEAIVVAHQGEVNEPLLRAIRSHAGDEGLRDLARAAALWSATSRHFGPVVEPLVRMFGLSPSVLFRVPPVAYRATFRGMGELVVVSTAPNCCALTCGSSRSPWSGSSSSSCWPAPSRVRWYTPG